jgi:16S rRNA (guanine966-N2)-methyltransferase
MRIIAGLARGMPLAVPQAGVRPTADRIREAIFSSLGAHVVEARVLDLFAGTGALGLEAASRGAISVMFVENARASIECLERNRATFQRNPEVTCEFSLARVAVESQLRKLATAGETFSLIFADPPYGPEAQDLLRNNFLPQLLAANGLLVLESAKRDALAVTTPWESVRSAIYGDTRVDFLRRESISMNSGS